jgi:hypothetical protein
LQGRTRGAARGAPGNRRDRRGRTHASRQTTARLAVRDESADPPCCTSSRTIGRRAALLTLRTGRGHIDRQALCGRRSSHSSTGSSHRPPPRRHGLKPDREPLRPRAAHGRPNCHRRGPPPQPRLAGQMRLTSLVAECPYATVVWRAPLGRDHRPCNGNMASSASPEFSSYPGVLRGSVKGRSVPHGRAIARGTPNASPASAGVIV